MMASERRTGFTSVDRSLVDEEELELTSVGVDIGSSTSHLIFSRLKLERRDSRYVVTGRTVLRESEILLTPYAGESSIDSDRLADFVDTEYSRAGLHRDDVDTGALILTGVALQRHNARAIGEVFAREAGKFVAVSAGDALEATMSAHGSGAVARSALAQGGTVNVDVGGGTTKVAVCRDGRVVEVTALDVGARLVRFEEDGIVAGVEPAGERLAAQLGVDVRPSSPLGPEERQALARGMVDRLARVLGGGPLRAETSEVLRLPPLSGPAAAGEIMFSGGVSEYLHGRERRPFGDLGPLLAEELCRRGSEFGASSIVPSAGIRATVIGASQYTVQVSGSTIFLSSVDAVPLRSVPVVRPDFDLGGEEIEPAEVRDAVRGGLARLGVAVGDGPAALALSWQGSATFARLQGFCSGVLQALRQGVENGQPIVVVSDGDVGGLLGLHLAEEMRVRCPVVSIDGVELRDFDYIDIGTLLPSSGSVPVVIKSLVFPRSGPVVETGESRTPRPEEPP